MVLAEWGGINTNLWQVELVTVPLIEGQASYTVNPNIVAMLDAYVTVTNGTVPTDRYIMPISRTEYASYANKTMQGFSTSYWYDRLLSPTVTLWPVPDGTTQSFNYYAVTQLQDANYNNGQQVAIPVYFLRAFAYGLARELSVAWAPDRTQGLMALAKEAYDIAANQNVENSALYISPTISSYWRA